MVAYSFNPIFVGPILAGTKRQTIRAERKRHARPGEAMQLYTGMMRWWCGQRPAVAASSSICSAPSRRPSAHRSTDCANERPGQLLPALYA
jgi:hypothetical protein